MDSTYWIIGIAAACAAAGILSFAWLLERTIVPFRWPPAPERLWHVPALAFMAWGCALLVGAVIAAPWSDRSRWTNTLALEVPPPGSSSPRVSKGPSPLISDLARQVGDDGTLVAVAISGGGSRAAYFAASVLERLSMVKWPGQNGGSLVEHINLISSVSGGSLAAAYFALNSPRRGHPGGPALATFFESYKQAMATNLELPALGEIFDLRHTLTMLALTRPMAEPVANAMDVVLTGGKATTMAALQARVAQGTGPMLLLNATRLDNTDPFVFAIDNQNRPIFTFARTPDNVSLPDLGRSHDHTRFVSFFDESHGDLGRYRIADAVAASAAYPVMLGSIALGSRYGETLRLGDGGLVDNLGLLTLYSVLLDPDLYRQTEGRLRRIVVIVIDSENVSIHPGLLAGLEGLSTWSGEALHRFVIPGMAGAARQRELGDVLAGSAWRTFSLPSPIFISYGLCNGKDVATRFLISEQDRQSVEETAKTCVLDAGIKKLEALLASEPEPPPLVYDGRFTSADLDALKALVDIALKERDWWQWKHTTVGIGRLTTEKPMWSPPRGSDGMRRAPEPIDALDQQELDRTKYDFAVEVQEGGSAIVRATPRVYRQSGRISFYVELKPALLDDPDICDTVQELVRGADKEGVPAGPDARLFGLSAKHCD